MQSTSFQLTETLENNVVKMGDHRAREGGETVITDSRHLDSHLTHGDTFISILRRLSACKVYKNNDLLVKTNFLNLSNIRHS